MSITASNDEGYTPAKGGIVVDLVVKYTGCTLNNDGTAANSTHLGIAVTMDDTVVPRAKWTTTPMAGVIGVVTAVQGGQE